MSQSGLPSLPVARPPATCRPQRCWSGRTATWRGPRRRRNPRLTNFVAAFGTGSVSEQPEAESRLFRGDFVLILLGHMRDGVVLRLRKAFARLAGTRGGVQGRLRLTLEMRHHFGGEQLSRPFGRRRVGPLVAHLQHAPESTGLIPHPLHLFACPLRRADYSGTVVVDHVDHLVDLLSGHGHLRKRGHLLEVPEPWLEAEFHVLAGLLFGFGDVEWPDQAPILTVDRGAKCRPALFHDVPVILQRGEAFERQRRPDGPQADAVL